MIRKFVSDFNTVMKKHEINKTIKELENLPPELKVNSDADLKKTADTYEDLMKGYQDVANDPDKKSNINIVVVKAKENRKNVILKKGAAIAVSVSAILGYLYLLQKKNDYKNYTTARDAIQESEYFRLKLYSSITKTIKSIGRNIKGTIKYGLKDVGEQLTRTGSYSDTPISAHQDGLKYLDLFYGQ